VFGGQFDDCFASWPSAAVAVSSSGGHGTHPVVSGDGTNPVVSADGTHPVVSGDADVSNAVDKCLSELSTASSLGQLTHELNKPNDASSTGDLPPSDVHVRQQFIVYLKLPTTSKANVRRSIKLANFLGVV